MSKSQLVTGLVLRRTNFGEQDRLVTVLSRELGKVRCLAKGVRKIGSSQAASLEIGSLFTGLLISSRSIPLLTQARLLNDNHHLKSSLTLIKKLLQILEVVDQLVPEELPEPEVFDLVLQLIDQLQIDGKSDGYQQVQSGLSDLLVQLGYQPLSETKYQSIQDYVSVVAERPLKSYQYLTTNLKGSYD